MQIQHIVYRLYSLGLRSGLHERIPLVPHRLPSIFYLYHQGFADGSKWVEEYYPKMNFVERIVG